MTSRLLGIGRAFSARYPARRILESCRLVRRRAAASLPPASMSAAVRDRYTVSMTPARMASESPTCQLATIVKTTPTTITTIARNRHMRSRTSGGRSRTLSRRCPLSHAGGVTDTGSSPDEVRSGAAALPVAAARTGRGLETCWFHAGCGTSRSAVGPSSSGGTSVVTTPSSIAIPSSRRRPPLTSVASSISADTSSTPESAYCRPAAFGGEAACRPFAERRAAIHRDVASRSDTEYLVPLTPAFCFVPSARSASGAGVTLTCTPSCSDVPGSADDLDFLLRGQAIHLTTSAYRYGRGRGAALRNQLSPYKGALKADIRP